MHFGQIVTIFKLTDKDTGSALVAQTEKRPFASQL